MTDAAVAAPGRLTVAWQGLQSRWRTSLRLRVVSITLLFSVVAIALLGTVMVQRIASGLIESRERSAVADASAGIAAVERVLAAADTGVSTPSSSRLVEAAVTTVASRAGVPPLYDVLLLATPEAATGAPERATNLVGETSLPEGLRAAVRSDPRLAWAWTTIRYLDGVERAGLVVGAGITVPGVGPYELYLLYPVDAELATIALIERTGLLAGVAMVLVLVLLIGAVTGVVLRPLGDAARAASRWSSGDLTERVPVTSDDEMGQLARSFNDMAASLERQIHRLENLSMVQQRFVSDVSHELRTPLTTIRMAADVLHAGRTDMDDSLARSSELLLQQLDRFESLLQDLLEISRFDAGVAVIEAEPMDVGELVRNVVADSTPLADELGTRIDVVGGGNCVAEVDARRVTRILRNLVTNALEHGEGRPIQIRVAGSDDVVAVAVRDHGVGMSAEQVPFVFDRFWRADPARTRRIGGTGLGLAIALEDARLHGGTLEAWGSPSLGANFVLCLPRHAHATVSESPIPVVPQDIP